MLELLGGDFPWYVVATVLFLLAGAVFRGIRHRRGIMGPEVFFLMVAAYFLDRFGWELWRSGERHERAVALSLLFAVLAPSGTLFWWGFHGYLRKAAFFVLKVLGLALMAFLLVSRTGMMAGLDALLMGLLTAVLLLLAPWTSWLRSLQKARRTRSTPEPSPSKAPEPEIRIKTLEAAIKRAETGKANVAAELDRIRDEVRRTNASEEKAAANLAERRIATIHSVRHIRAQERSRLETGQLSFSWHPELGLLMAEGWRVLRAEIALGERIPPIEHDEFFFEVVLRLLKAPDAFDRYFHDEGREIGAALMRFINGEAPLEETKSLLLTLRSENFAPVPVSGPDELLEAWLVPVRRHQERQRERFLAGIHSLQADLEAYFEEEGRPQTASDSISWRMVWDEAPWVFLGSDPVDVPRPARSNVRGAEGRRTW